MIGKILSFFNKPGPKAPVIPDYIEIAISQLGVHEVPGPGDNPKIVEYHSATSLGSKDDEVAWCSAFVNWCLMKTGYQRSHSAAARSWLAHGKPLGHFKPYCIVVFERGDSVWQGHVAFGISDLGQYIRVLGGNQSDGVTYANYPKSRVLAYLEPVKLAAT